MQSAANTNDVAERRRGIVKSFGGRCGVSGYGFIGDHALQASVFVHHTQVAERMSWLCLRPGDEVEYSLCSGPKGYYAESVTVIRKCAKESA